MGSGQQSFCFFVKVGWSGVEGRGGGGPERNGSQPEAKKQESFVVHTPSSEKVHVDRYDDDSSSHKKQLVCGGSAFRGCRAFSFEASSKLPGKAYCWQQELHGKHHSYAPKTKTASFKRWWVELKFYSKCLGEKHSTSIMLSKTTIDLVLFADKEFSFAPTKLKK